MRSRRAFTLVELLVVIAILALLISLLLPGLGRARGQAREIACGSNLRQIALANLLYAQDNDDRYCPGAADAWANRRRWHGARDYASGPFDAARGPLTRYFTTDEGIRTCPAWRCDLAENDASRFEKNCGAYGYNAAFVGRWLERDGAGYTVKSDAVGARLEHVRQPAQTVMFADAAFAGGGAVIEYSFIEPRYFPVWGTHADPSIHFRHARNARIAWCDGHVDRRPYADSWSSGLYPVDPATHDIGWFGDDDDNSFFDLD